MKSQNKIYLILLAAVMMAATPACKKWLDVNYNPLQLTDAEATPDVVLGPLLQQTGNYHETYLYCWMGYWSYWNFSPAEPVVSYYRPGSISGQIFFGVNGPTKDIFLLENKSRAAGEYFYLGIAKVIRALAWSGFVDHYNDVPYSEAFNPAILQPKYDKGHAIYEDLMVQLDSAATFIKMAVPAQNPRIALADIMFHGDKTQWIKFVNTLKLRLLIHQAARVDRQAYIQTQIREIIAEGSGFLNTGQNGGYNPGYNGIKDPNTTNPYFSYYSPYIGIYAGGGGEAEAGTSITSNDIAHAGLYAMELLKKEHDPRLGFFYSAIDQQPPAGAAEPFQQSAPQNFRANKFGLLVNATVYPYQDALYVSPVGGAHNSGLVSDTASGVIKGRNMDMWVITSVESLFLQAEAIQRGWLPGDPGQAYQSAVKESFRWLNVGHSMANPSLSDAIFKTWYDAEVAAANPEVSWDDAPDKYKLLMFQKYMALNGIEPLETWDDYRRNGRYPNIPVSVSPARVGNSIPVRLLYNAEEYILNPAAKAEGDIDIFNSKIWWMP